MITEPLTPPALTITRPSSQQIANFFVSFSLSRFGVFTRTLSGCLRSYLMTDAVFSHPPRMISYIGLDSPFLLDRATCALLLALTSIITAPLLTLEKLYDNSFRVDRRPRPYENQNLQFNVFPQFNEILISNVSSQISSAL